MSTNIMTDVAAAIIGRENQKAIRFQELVEAVANGDSEPTEVVQTLDELGRTLSELQKAVDYIATRRAWREEGERIPTLQQKLANVRTEIEREENNYKEQTERFAKTIQPLRDKAHALESQMMQAYAKCKKLKEGYRGPLIAELRITHIETERLVGELAIAREQKSLIHWDLKGPVAALVGLTQERRIRLDGRLDNAETEIGRLELAIADSRERAHEIERGMMQP